MARKKGKYKGKGKEEEEVQGVELSELGEGGARLPQARTPAPGAAMTGESGERPRAQIRREPVGQPHHNKANKILTKLIVKLDKYIQSKTNDNHKLKLKQDKKVDKDRTKEITAREGKITYATSLKEALEEIQSSEQSYFAISQKLDALNPRNCPNSGKSPSLTTIWKKAYGAEVRDAPKARLISAIQTYIRVEEDNQAGERGELSYYKERKDVGKTTTKFRRRPIDEAITEKKSSMANRTGKITCAKEMWEVIQNDSPAVDPSEELRALKERIDASTDHKQLNNLYNRTCKELGIEPDVAPQQGPG